MIIYDISRSNSNTDFSSCVSSDSLADLSNATSVTINSLRQALQIQSLIENGHFGGCEL